MVKKISWVDTNWYVWTRTAKYNYFFDGLSNPDLIETLQLFNRMNNFQWQPCTFFSREKTTRNVHAFVENQSKGFSKPEHWAILHNDFFSLNDMILQDKSVYDLPFDTSLLLTLQIFTPWKLRGLGITTWD